VSPFVQHFFEPRVNGWLGRRGLRITRAAPPLDLRSTADLHPLAGRYENEARPVLLRVPLARCRHLNWLAFPCTQTTLSPFVQTLFAHTYERCEQYEDSPLARFYGFFQPQNAAQLMGLGEAESPFFASLPPCASPYPWQAQLPQDKAALRAYQVAQDNREHGASFGLSDGDTFFGPVSRRKGQLEFERLVRVHASLRDNGLRIDETGLGNIRVTCLLSQDASDWRFIVAGGGQHRLAALTALRYDEIVVQWEPGSGLIRRADAAHWPAVRRAEMSLEQAHEVFDRIFAGRPPKHFPKY